MRMSRLTHRTWRSAGLVSALWLLAGCGPSQAPAATAAPGDAAAAAVVGPKPAASPPPAAAEAPPPASGLAARQGELVNPDDATMVFLYHDLAGVAPPIDSWVEDDSRVMFAHGPDKAARRASVKAEFEAGMASVRDVGVLHLSVDTRLSEYDPSYGEYTIGALSPGSTLQFGALREKVQLKFANALAAQTWTVPEAEVRAIEDKLDRNRLGLDLTLRIRSVQPGPGGGTLTADVLDYTLRNTGDGTTIVRKKVAGG